MKLSELVYINVNPIGSTLGPLFSLVFNPPKPREMPSKIAAHHSRRTESSFLAEDVSRYAYNQNSNWRNGSARFD